MGAEIADRIRAAGKSDAALNLPETQNRKWRLNLFGHASLLLMHTGYFRIEAIMPSRVLRE